MNVVKGILLMGGKGERFNSSSPKQFSLLQGKKVYQWALERFVSSKLFDQIILVCPPNSVEEIQHEVGEKALVVAGGSTRQESSYKGLLCCGQNTDIVVIHDAVRPFVSDRILKENVKRAQRYHAVNTCIPSTDTLVYAPGGHTIKKIPNRAEYMRGQTPQSFAYPLILKTHQETKRVNATDDCSLVIDTGQEIHIVIGEEKNMKITSPVDLLIAERLLYQYI